MLSKYRSSLSSSIAALSPISLSVLAHFSIVVAWAIVYYFPDTSYLVPIDYIEVPEFKPRVLNPAAKPAKPKPKPKVKPKAVFGQSRKALVNTKSDVTVKAGNTVTKEVDDKVLEEDDPDALPIPSEEYLVSDMPILVNEFRIPYPEPAKSKGTEGSVVMDLLIDKNGVVRKVDVVDGPGDGLTQAAASAVKRFKFQPARIEGEPVAVQIRYIYRFVMER